MSGSQLVGSESKGLTSDQGSVRFTPGTSHQCRYDQKDLGNPLWVDKGPLRFRLGLFVVYV